MRRSTAISAAAALTVAGSAAAATAFVVVARAAAPRPVPPFVASAAVLAAVREEAPLPPPRLMVAPKESLSLAQADVHVSVNGFLAKTRLTLTFRNDADRVLEGTLDFPLPAGAALTGYGLDVNGELVDAVPVEKHEARIAFEKEVRRGADPGIIEETAGNNFRTRVYPIPAHGARTVRVEYVTDLRTAGKDAFCTVPLRWNLSVPLAHITVEVAQPSTGTAPVLRFAGLDRPLDFERQSNGRYVAERTLEQVMLADDLIVSLPGGAGKPQAAVERFTRASSVSPDYYFAIDDIAPSYTDKRAQLAAQPRHIGVIWDASLSRRTSDVRREARLLGEHLRGLGGDVDVEVILLRDEIEAPRHFRVSRGNASVLMKFLQGGFVYDGGTNLPAARFPAGCDYYLLFTDGLGTLGSPNGMPALPKVPVYAVATDPKANHALLRLLARQTGGAYYDLTSSAPNGGGDATVARSIGRPRYSLLSVQGDGQDIANATGVGTPVETGQHVRIAGELRGSEATVTLNYGLPGGPVLAHSTFTVKRTDAADGSLIGPFWARRRVEELMGYGEEMKIRGTISALGRDFNIVTPNTSLMVLETLDQYFEHDIVPPRSRKEIYAAFIARRESEHRTASAQKADKLQHVLTLWREKVAWWEKTYSPGTPRKSPDHFGRRGDETVGRGFAGRPAEAPEPALFSVANPSAATPPPPRPQVVDGAAVQAPVRESSATGVGGLAGGAGGAVAPRQTRTLARAGAAAPSSNLRYGLADAKKDGEESDEAGVSAGAEITIKEWSPDTPYLTAMRRAPSGKAAYSVFLEQRRAWGNSPAFYLDSAEMLRQRGEPALARRVLTDITDLLLEEPQLLRIVAHRLQQLGRRDMAIALFRQVLRLRPEEPQSYRDLALALSDRADALAASGNAKAALADYKSALSLLSNVVMKQWDRFDEIESIALMEANRIIAHAKPVAAKAGLPLSIPFDTRLVKNLPCDVRIVMTWDTDQTDMDLHVIEPTGEECFYSHNRTAIGGRLSRDFTDGYGPEEYLLRRTMKGAYKIQSNYYGTRQQTLTGGTTVQATVITDWGRPTEKRRELTLRLSRQKETVDIGTVRL